MRSVHSTFYDGYTSFVDSATVHAPLPITPANNTAVRHFRLEAGYAAGNPKTNLFNMLDSVMNNPGVDLQILYNCSQFVDCDAVINLSP